MSILEGSLKAVEQDESLVTFGFNVSSQDEHILFNQPCEKVHNHIRGLIGWPVGYARLNGTRFKFMVQRKPLLHQIKNLEQSYKSIKMGCMLVHFPIIFV